MAEDTQYLITLPAAGAGEFAARTGRQPPQWFASADPPAFPLGSGGGTASVLLDAWRATAPARSFSDWLAASRKLCIHGGGLSRRVPAYAPSGKPLMPVPVWRWMLGQRLDQTLLDLQLPAYEHVLAAAPGGARLLVTSGDVLIRLPSDAVDIPSADIVCLGMWLTPEQARNFGVFFLRRDDPGELACFVQKPPPARIRELASEHLYLADSGMWLFSARAIDYLLRKTGWAGGGADLGAFRPRPYGLYEELGPELGRDAAASGFAGAGLTCKVVPLPGAEFHHFGTSRDIIRSNRALQNAVVDQRRIGLMGAIPHPDQFVLNASFQHPLRRDENHTLWVENACIPASWTLANSHVLTGVPENDWPLALREGVCLDFVPVGATACAVRFYGIDDAFRGPAGDAHTRLLGEPAPEWFARRGLPCVPADGAADIHDLPLFPVLEPSRVEPRFLQWLIDAQPADNAAWAPAWTGAERVSAAQLLVRANVRRLFERQRRNMTDILPALIRNHRTSIFYKLDLDATAGWYAATPCPVPEPLGAEPGTDPMKRVHNRVFRAALKRRRGAAGWEEDEQAAFRFLADLVIHQAEVQPVDPVRTVLNDQIIWGRSPLRMDLAGGWSDTPPYCLEFGGSVVNLAVDLNGQPPVQVFARVTERPHIVLRSIDQGVEERITTYAELETYRNVTGVFSIPKAAMAIAGFLPRFNARRDCDTLAALLTRFGGGIELSMLAAVPKGSGLGTSSILSATVLGVLSDLCGLGWDRHGILRHTLMVEQMLTSGGGWQDQAGGIFPGVKMIETEPGLVQTATLRWVSDRVFSADEPGHPALLYYTGITRTAHNILKEIVRGIFLNKREHLQTIGRIRENAQRAFHALLRADRAQLGEAVRTSWRLNQELDPGTNPPSVQRVLERVGDCAAAYKLLGAGGGGFLLILAKDLEAAARIRAELTRDPPNRTGRFVDFQVSSTGLQITRS